MAISEATNAAVIDQVLSAVKADQQGDNRYRGLCPAHDDHNPSLDIYINADGYIGFNCLSRKCKSFEIIKALKDKFGIEVPTPSRSSSKTTGRLINTKVLYPAHESAFPFPFRKDDDIIYEYTTETGEVAFFVQRYMENNKKQTPAWFSVEDTSDEGKVVRRWAAKDPPKSGRPIYNLHLLAHYANNPVLIVEGEKTAEAAMKLPQLAGFVITTWSGGSKNVKASNWKVLKDRQTPIYLWPDHDAEGKKAMTLVAGYITSGDDDNRLSMLDYGEFQSTRINTGWDLADGYANMECDYSFEDLWNGFKPYYTTEEYTSDNMEEALAKRDRYLRKIYLAGSVFVVNISTPDFESPFSYRYYKDKSSLLAMDTECIELEVGNRIKTIPVVDQWYTTRGEKDSVFLNGVKFNPNLNQQELTDKDGRKYLNTFTGFPAFKKLGTDRLIKVWLEHIEKMIPDIKTRDWVIDYFADIFQNPSIKPGTALVLIGHQGVGKSSILMAPVMLLGPRLAKIISKDMKNNTALANSLFVYQDEWSVNHYKEKLYYESLKNAITATRLKLEEKYLPSWEADSYCRFAFTSNDEKPIRLPPDDRRFTVVDCNSFWFSNKEHFNELFAALTDEAALAGLLTYFKTRKITSNLRYGYITNAKEKLIESENKLLMEMISWANVGSLPHVLVSVLGTIVDDFGEKDILIPRSIIKDYMRKTHGQSSFNNSDIAMLRDLFPGPIYKRRMEVRDFRGGLTTINELCHIIPPFAEFRKRLEKEFGREIRWADQNISSESKLDPDKVVQFEKKKPDKSNKDNKEDDKPIL